MRSDPKPDEGVQADEDRDPTQPLVKRVVKGGVLLEVRHLAALTFQDVSLYIQPGEVVAVTGAGQEAISALLEALAGVRRPSEGEVRIDGVELYPNLRVFRPRIGYAPSANPVQPSLTVVEALRTAARFRLPRGTPREKRHQRVEAVLAGLGLSAQRDQRIGRLPVAERLRTSLGIELVGDPKLLVVQEPDEVVNPGDEARLAVMVHEQAEQGRTVIIGTQSPEIAAAADRVAILTRDGSLAWYGPPAEALEYFRETLQISEPVGYGDLLAAVDNPENPSGKEWAKRFAASPAYGKNIDAPLFGKQQDLLLEDRPLSRIRSRGVEAVPPPPIPRVSSLGQLFLLIGRNFKLFFRDRTAVAIAFLVPVLLAGLEFVLAGPDIYDPLAGDATRVVLVTALIAFLVLLVAALSWMREIVKEQEVFRRERLNGLKLVPYALSKAWWIIPVAIFQALVWTGGHLAATNLPAGIEAAPGFLITLALLALCGGLLGLVASALASAPQSAPLWVLALIIPQLMIGGALVPETRMNGIGQAAARVTPLQYGFAALITAGGHGKDVASDPCWQLPDADRRALTDSQKQACSCMGMNIFSKCHFPGVWKEFTSILESPAPELPKPDSGVNIPVQPVLGPGESLDEYAKAVNDYTLQLEIYQGSIDGFTASLRQYAQDLSDWQQQRSLAIGGAEGRISTEVENYGPILQVDLTSQWLALAGLSLLTLFILIGVLKGKDVRR